MKEGIHPKYEQTTIRCACGAVIETGSTKKDITVEICSKCHPFYTGKQKLVDTSGRVDKFNKKYGIKRQGIILFYIVLRFAAMPVPALAVKARPGSGRGCTNGGLASSAHGRRKTAVPVGRDRAFSIFILFSGLPRCPSRRSP